MDYDQRFLNKKQRESNIYSYGKKIYELPRTAFDGVYDSVNEQCNVCQKKLMKKLDTIKKHFIRKHQDICAALTDSHSNGLEYVQQPFFEPTLLDQPANDPFERKLERRSRLTTPFEEQPTSSHQLSTPTIAPSLFGMFKSKIAVVQAGSLLYNTHGTLDKLEKLVAEASSNGAHLILFPEAFVGGYPKALTFGISMGKRSDKGRDEFKKYYETAIEYDGPESERIAEFARNYGVNIVVGVVEREGGTLYCSVFFYGPDGEKLGKHRKLMPTALERCVWGFGDGSTMPVVDTTVGKVAAAICWESYMPLLRVGYYNKGVQIYLAPTVDDRESWLSLMRTVAMEGRCFVISACQFLTSADFPSDHDAYDKNGEILISGGSCAVDPMGKVLLQPDFNGESVYYVEVDLGEIPRGKFDLDTVGHYSRPDVFQLIINERKQNVVEIKR